MLKRRVRNYLRRGMALMNIGALLVMSSYSAQALSIPSVPKVASQIEDRYNINKESVQNFSQGFNVADNKKQTPEVSLFFDITDPKPGQKVTARALPTLFSTPSESLYYTWYIKRKDCTVSECDYNHDGKYDSKDWRIEAAENIAQNGYSSTDAGTSYASDTDSDGYKAHFGGDDQIGKPDYCAVSDPGSGKIYELMDTGSATSSFGCSSGKLPTCMAVDSQVTSGSSSNTFNETSSDCTISGGCFSSGTPMCSGTTASCVMGTPCCVTNPGTATTCEEPILSCSQDEAILSTATTNLCKHVFAQPPSSVGDTGDGVFGREEERFWSTDPNDPSTANNGNKDEANVVGVGADHLAWNYLSGDQVGVAVEGTSLIPTKHDDSSYYIMWAFPKNKCNPSLVGASTGQYTETVKKYPVTFPSTNLDPNDCIKENLVDPTEGGQASNLDVHVDIAPDTLVNDETDDKSGDVAVVRATVNNALSTNDANMHYTWNIDVSSDVRFANAQTITADARKAGLIKSTEGSGLGQVYFSMNMNRTDNTLMSALSGGSGYIRFRVKIEENVDGGGVRIGKGDALVKFTSMGKRIMAYRADPVQVGSDTHVTLHAAQNSICNSSSLERAACRVVKNEVIGVKIDPTGLKDFSWKVNQNPLVCTKALMSPDCLDGTQGNVAFFPVTGNVGESYEVSVTANNIQTGQSITLSRLFYVVDPYITLVSSDTASAWPKLLGYYNDVLGKAGEKCPSGMCPDYSNSALQAFSGSTAVIHAEYTPSFMQSYSGVKEWSVDGTVVQESAPNTITIPVEKVAGGIYDITLQAVAVQSDQIRRALHDVWNVSPLDSTEIRMQGGVRIEVQSPDLANASHGVIQKYYALLSSYIPETLLFTLRMLLLGVVVLFSAHFIGSLLARRGIR